MRRGGPARAPLTVRGGRGGRDASPEHPQSSPPPLRAPTHLGRPLTTATHSLAPTASPSLGRTRCASCHNLLGRVDRNGDEGGSSLGLSSPPMFMASSRHHKMSLLRSSSMGCEDIFMVVTWTLDLGSVCQQCVLKRNAAFHAARMFCGEDPAALISSLEGANLCSCLGVNTYRVPRWVLDQASQEMEGASRRPAPRRRERSPGAGLLPSVTGEPSSSSTVAPCAADFAVNRAPVIGVARRRLACVPRAIVMSVQLYVHA